MPSEFYTTTRLDPFFQQFLKSHFNSPGHPFAFPRGADLAKRLVLLLRTRPEDCPEPGEDSWAFHILLPNTPHKDPFYYNYLSGTGQKAFASQVKSYFDMVFHERMGKLRQAGFEKKTCVEIFLDEHELPIDGFDRLIKDANRWNNRVRQQRFRQKNNAQSPKNAPKKTPVMSRA
jgi:hypothetical protein